MKYKLIDYTTETQEDVILGTCDLCMSTGHTIDFPYFHIQDETGVTHEVPGFMWSGGDLFDIYIENIPHFAAWLAEQDIEIPGNDYDYSWLSTVVYHYDAHLDMLHDFSLWLDDAVIVENNTIRIFVDDESEYYLNNYSLNQILETLEFCVGVQINDHNLYRVINQDPFDLPGDAVYAGINWFIKDDCVGLSISQYDAQGNYLRNNEVPLGLSCGEIIMTFHGDALPEIFFETS